VNTIVSSSPDVHSWVHPDSIHDIWSTVVSNIDPVNEIFAKFILYGDVNKNVYTGVLMNIDSNLQ
jgi:hypothetical protein